MSALHFNYVKYKNILSTGNSWTEIQLDKNKSTLIVGENGAGKSTMLDAICFALYGKPFRRINKPQLVNSINQKNMEVEVSFKTGGKDYIIKRGIKPNIFEIWRGTELLNQDAAARDYQSYLEEHVLKMNFKSFGQIVVLGSSTFVPFMQLPAASRREVIEDLLDIQIFTNMNVLLKEKIVSNKNDIQEVKYKIDLLKQKISDAKDHNASILKIKKTEVQKIKKKVQEHLDFIDEENDRISAIEEQVFAKYNTIKDKDQILNKLQELYKLDANLLSKKNKLETDNLFFVDNDNCPTCRQEIDEQFKTHTIETNKIKIHDVIQGYDLLKDKVTKTELRKQAISDVESEITQLNMKIQEHRANVKISKTTLKGMKKDLLEAEKDVKEIDTQKIHDLELDLQTYRKDEEHLINQREILSVVASMLKDGGIKTRIIKQYVPVMNKLINKYLAAMDFFVDFQLDESFNETILSRFRDSFSYASFSEGEKLRIDLSLLFTWRAVSKLRNSVSTNLLVMDEIMDSSLDSAGTEEFLKIINELSEDSNIFIISHKGDQLADKFKSTIKFKKIKNFSVME